MSSHVWLIWYCLKFYVIGFYALLIEIFFQISSKPFQDIPQVENGQVAIVTGGASGIGYQVTRKLALRNVHVIIAARCERESSDAIARIRAEKSNAKVEFIPLDLASLKSVDQFVARRLPLHILVNNAGIMLVPYTETCDGLESHFQVNYLAHLYLTCLLLNNIKESGKQDRCSRIINLSSIVHLVADVDDICQRCEQESLYSPHAAYASSKLAIILSSYWLNEQLRGGNFHVSVNAVHPGVVSSNLYSNVHWSIRWVMDIMAHLFFRTTSDAADSVIYLALSQEVEGQSGGYFTNQKFVQSKSCTYSRILQEKVLNISRQYIDVNVSGLLRVE